MTDVMELRETATDVIRFARRGQEEFSARLVVADLVHPLLRLIDAMETQRGERWRTLSEAMADSGRRRNYFERRLVSLGHRTRLEAWRESGLADRTPEGLWLISPAALAEVKRGRSREQAEQTMAASDDLHVDIAAVVDDFVRTA